MLRQAQQDRPDVAARRTLWKLWQRFMDSSAFVFLDETGASTDMVRQYGWGPRGERLVDAAPHGHWFTTTPAFAGAGSSRRPARGRRHRTLRARRADEWRGVPAYVEQFLAPALRPGDVVVMDNLAAHKVAGVEAAIRAVGASVLYLPASSPDLNPIEKMFSKLKAMLRKAKARTLDELWDEIGRIIRTIAPEECRNYIASAGYACE